MSAKVLKTIAAGSSPVYEIIQHPEKITSVILRVCGDPKKQFELPKSLLLILSRMLREIYDETYES